MKKITAIIAIYLFASFSTYAGMDNMVARTALYMSMQPSNTTRLGSLVFIQVDDITYTNLGNICEIKIYPDYINLRTIKGENLKITNPALIARLKKQLLYNNTNKKEKQVYDDR